MKQLTCEMCGSTDLTKQDGVFVCQSCGCIYSAEETKQMIEGIVDVSGSTIKVDTTNELENLYKLARRAKNDNNAENAAKYYGMILIKEPSSWEAAFYSVYYRALNCKIYQIASMVKSIKNCLDGVFALIVKHSENNTLAAVTEVYSSTFAAANIFMQNSVDIYKKSSRDKEAAMDFNNRACACAALLYTLGGELRLLYISSKNEKIKALSLSAIKGACTTIKLEYATLDAVYQRAILDNIKGLSKTYSNSIKKWYEPDYKDPLENVEAPKESGGCYVATAVYGSYDCPQVWTLRRFRDYTLSETWYGRAFIRTYYAISPTLVKWFGRTDWFKKMWKGKLDRMVASLNAEGVEDSPYEDKEW